MVTWLDNLRASGFLAKGAALGLAAFGLLALVTPVAWCIGGATGVAAAIVAASVCFAGAASAMAIYHVFRRPHQAASLLLAGIATRMGLPLALALAIHFRGGPLAEAGLLYYLVVFYSATLAVETILSLPPRKRSAAANDPPAADEG